MHTNACENIKFIFYKMVHDQIYDDLIMPSIAVRLQNGKIPF